MANTIEHKIKLTAHAIDKSKSRLKLNSKALKRLAVKAYNEGLQYNDVNGCLKDFLDTKSRLQRFKHQSVTFRIYGEIVYIFVYNKEQDIIYLLTVYQIPRKLKAQALDIFNKKKLKIRKD